MASEQDTPSDKHEHDDQSADLHRFTKALIKDLEDLRAGEITNADARVRAQLAREVLRSAHLQLQGMRFMAGQARALPEPDDQGR